MLSHDTVHSIIKMLGMLGSLHDGEVLAAARAIGRKLKADNATWGDLIQALNKEPKTVIVREPASRASHVDLRRFFEEERRKMQEARRRQQAQPQQRPMSREERVKAARDAMEF